MSDTKLEARLARIESAIGDLKPDKLTAKQLQSVNKKVAAASKKFVNKPSLESAKVFLTELDTSAKLAPSQTGLAWTTVTVTVVTILSDDQG